MQDGKLQQDTIKLVAAILIAVVGVSITAYRATTSPGLTRNDLTPDYVSAKAWTRSQDPYAPVQTLMDRYVGKGVPYYGLNSDTQINSHPPIYLVLLSPLALLPLRAARLCWLLLMSTLLFAGLYRVCRRLGWNWQTSSIIPLILLALPVVDQDLLFGQINCLLMFLFVWAWLDLDSGHERRAGLWLGIATALKFFPAFLLLALFRRRGRVAIAYQIGTAAFLSIVGTALVGPHQTVEFAKGIPHDAAYWRGLPVNISLTGHIYRWLTHNHWHLGAPDVPLLAHTLEITAVAVMVVLALKSRHILTRDPLWACVPMMLLITPLSWVAGLVMAMPILPMLFKAMTDSSVARRVVLLIIAAGLVIGPPQALINANAATLRVFIVFAITTMILIVLVAMDSGLASANPQAVVSDPATSAGPTNTTPVASSHA